MNTIKILIGLLGIFLFSLSGIVSAQSDATTQLSQLLSNFRTYQAKFNQITFDGQDRVIQQSHGRVMIMRPGRFRWETDSPTKQIIITNGKTLWVYDVDLSQATQQPLAQKTNINPASLLSGSVKDLKQKFTITISPTSDAATFQLVPRLGKSLNFNWIRLKFSKKQLTEMTVLNNLDERSIFQFSQIKVNAPLSSTLFEFKPSRGIDVVKQ
ncbi:outer membrane lipoprotein chaperone LolA [Coxiella burnetii]|uniref:Outer-membrane lipoprotein carrier protein n=1 Tax=Coxiella burnetii (strain CbuK_Q154) TaxID=434924 RepID=LOLA_COXB1|nr:outer membrane lipoprotein chaperone LolA [Coxiella burnetii]B6J7K9.1 RecName: Full=Outer-membrane lipoprotein carrier protein; Flags: Precursor [Coxiella burnetii CbuK_Q154]ACJ20258.1 outer-membrane lipoproteins carrier protein [Coxiella burnetii CbuK_Q154]EAX32504.1 outer membrane lipoprotein carrier protein LolA [Coxiella burnetii 'MSU Goat Q177']UYK68979.1 outer membrane lipoprotein chaperone LolA [Coxiella burnetii]